MRKKICEDSIVLAMDITSTKQKEDIRYSPTSTWNLVEQIDPTVESFQERFIIHTGPKK